MAKVNVNTASKEELIKGLDLSPAEADKIIKERQEPFKTKEDLKNRLGETLARKLVENGSLSETDKTEASSNQLEDIFKLEIEIDEDGKPRPKGSIDLAPFIKSLGEGSKNDDAKIERALRKLWEGWADLVKDLLRRADEEGLDSEDIKELRKKIKELRRKLKKVGRELDKVDTDDEKVKEGLKEASELLEDIQNLIED